MFRKDRVAALDVGTSTIVALAASATPDGRLTVRGVGTVEALGIRRGFIAAADQAALSIRSAVREASRTSGLKIDAVHLAVSGAHAEGINSRAAVAVTGRNGEVTAEDVRRATDAASAVRLLPGRDILHVVPQRFLLDEQDHVVNPSGMAGVRLEAQVHVVTARTSPIQNLAACVGRANVSVLDVIAEPFADSHAVLTDDEKELGVAIVNIGAGVTTVAIFDRGVLVHTGALDIGGDHLTNDVAVALRMPVQEAESLKCRCGCALSGLVDDDETIEVASIGGRPPRTMRRRLLADVLQPRVEAICHGVARQIRTARCEERLNAGVVLTGGSAMLRGVEEVAELTLALPVRRGVPQGLGGLMDHIEGPAFATAAGALLYGHANRTSSRPRLQSLISLLGL